MRVRLEFKPQDCWVGVYWLKTTHPYLTARRYDVWLCLVPTLPLHFWRVAA